MRERWAGPLVVVLILGGVIAVIALNLNLKGRNSADPASHPARSTETDRGSRNYSLLSRSCASRPVSGSIRSATKS